MIFQTHWNTRLNVPSDGGTCFIRLRFRNNRRQPKCDRELGQTIPKRRFWQKNERCAT